MRARLELRIGTWSLLVAMSMGCRSPRSDDSPADAAIDASVLSRDASVALDASSSLLPWPPLDDEKHCASVRRIAGFMQVVPAWYDAAGYLMPRDLDAGSASEWPVEDAVRGPRALEDGGGGQHARGKEIPSGFTSCTWNGSVGTSVNWATSYACESGSAPDESAALARFSELTAVWRRCFSSSGLKEVPQSPKGSLPHLS